MSARVDLEGYPNSLKTGQNLIISSQGGAVMREGGEFISYAANNSQFRVFQFLRGGEQSDILLEVHQGFIRYWIDDGEPALYTDNTTILSDEDDGELLTDEDDGEFLSVGAVITSNPYKIADLDDLYFVNQDKYAIICSANHPPLYITFRADGSILSELLPLERIPYFDYNDANSPTLSSELSGWRISFPIGWQNSGFGYHVAYNNVFGGNIYTYQPTNDAANAANIQQSLTDSALAQGYSTAFVVTPVADVAGAYDVAVSGSDAGYQVGVYLAGYYFGGDGSGYLPAQMPPLSQKTDSDAGVERAWSYPMWVLHNGIYYQCVRVHRSDAASEPGVGVDWTLYWTEIGIEKPNGFDYQFPSGNAWNISYGIYSPMNRGFPTVACFHEQRLIFMANKDNPTALYGSGINAYQDFLIGANDDEAWIFVLDSSDSPQIKWAISDRNLLLGTSSGEWIISAEVTITPTDINAERQNAARSHLSRPVQVDRETFYIEQGGRKLRATSYVRQKGAFSSQNASILMEHLISKEGINRLAIQHIPEVQITMVTNDGQAVLLTYEPIGQVIAASELVTDGFIYDAASYFSIDQNRDYTYLSVWRNGNWILERLRYPCSKQCLPLTENGVVLMDSWVTGEIIPVAGQGALTGLSHLNGKSVGVLINDAWIEGPHIVTNGQVLVDSQYVGENYAVGLLYEMTLETFEIEDNIQGTGLGAKRRWNSLTTRLLNSSLPKVYSQRSRDRTPSSLMGTPETIREGTQDVTQNVKGYGDGSIIVVQDRPYPTHIIAFFGEYQVEDR